MPQHPIQKICSNCGELVELEEGHSCWICPICEGFINRKESDEQGSDRKN